MIISKWPTSLVLAMVEMILMSTVFFPVTRTPGSTSPDFTKQWEPCATTHHCVSQCTPVPLPQCLDRVRSVGLLVPTDETVDGLQYTEHRKIHPIKLDGFDQNCESNHDWHGTHKNIPATQGTSHASFLLHRIVTPCVPEDSSILLAQPVRNVLFTDFYFSRTCPFFHRDVCQQGFFGPGPPFKCKLTRNLRVNGEPFTEFGKHNGS